MFQEAQVINFLYLFSYSIGEISETKIKAVEDCFTILLYRDSRTRQKAEDINGITTSLIIGSNTSRLSPIHCPISAIIPFN